MARVSFIIADHNQGKTSRMIQLTKTLETGSFDGYACVKRFSKHHDFLGYDLLHLTSGELMPALDLKEHYHDEYKDFFVFGPFVFSQEAFYTAERTLLSAFDDPKITTILMDEVGQVELMDMGYAWILKEALKTDKALVICVNERFFENILNHFKIKDHTLIKPMSDSKF